MNEIKAVILDVDGTLTDGSIIYGNDNVEIKSFNVYDGLAIKALSQINILSIILTGRESKVVSRRAKELNCEFFQGIENKFDRLKEILWERNIAFENVLYIGDDIPDYAAMKLCGFKACPANSVSEIKTVANYVSALSGGNGAVRDILEHFLKLDGRWNIILKKWGINNEFWEHL